MARVQNTLIGRASGSVGNIVFLTIKLFNVIRSKPISVSNPNTDFQKWQRNRFGQTVSLYRLLKSLISVGLKNRNRKMSVFNYFQHISQQDMFTDLPDGLVGFVPSKMQLSKGLIQSTNVVIDGLYPDTTGFYLIWRLNNVPSNSSDTDVPYALIWNQTQDIWTIPDYSSYTRGDGGIPFVIGVEPTPFDVYHAWLFFVNPVSGLISDTSYATEITPDFEYEVVRRINCGGNAITATDGKINWQADAANGAGSGTGFTVNRGTRNIIDATSWVLSPDSPPNLPTADFNQLFATERFVTAPAGTMIWTFTGLGTGVFGLRMYYGNSEVTPVTSMDLIVDGETLGFITPPYAVATVFDLFNIPIVTGSLSLGVDGVANFGYLSGIEILKRIV